MVTLRPVIEEAQRIAQLTRLNISVGEHKSPYHNIAIQKMVLAEIVANYTLIDEELCVIIEKYFFKDRDHTKKIRLLRQHIIGELYLLKKMEIVHAIKEIPKSVRNAIYDLNVMRHRFVHSLHPEKRRGDKKHITVFYRGKDLRTYEGLKVFMEDTHRAHMYLWRRSFYMGRSPKQKKTRLSRSGSRKD